MRGKVQKEIPILSRYFKYLKILWTPVSTGVTTFYENINIDKSLSEKLQSVAKKQGVSSDTLINLWIQQKLQEKPSP